MNKVKGVTLVELAISMVIAGILFTVAFVSWPGDSINVDSQVRQLVSDVNYIRLLAMANHNSYQVNLSASGYTTTKTDGTTAVSLPAHNGNSVTFLTGISATYTNSTLIFDNLGEPYSNVGTALNSTATITLTGTDGSSYTVSISPGTGYLSIA